MKHVGELGREALHDGTVIPVRVASTITAIKSYILKILQFDLQLDHAYIRQVLRTHIMRMLPGAI